MKLKDVYEEITIGRLGVVNEAGLSRLLYMAQKKDFCIATGFRYDNTLSQNRARNRELNSILASKKMGGYSLIGHWQEAPDGVDYKDANPEELNNTTEESVLFTRPDEMPVAEFVKFCGDIGRRFNQDAVIVDITGATKNKAWAKNFRDKDNRTSIALSNENVMEAILTEKDEDIAPGVYLVFKDGSMDKIGNTLSIGKVSQAYSRMRKKPNVPFIFEGILQPTSNISKQAFKQRNIKYLV